MQRNVLAMSGRAVEAAGDVQTLLLDKTGTITLGNRMASDFFPVGGHSEQEVADAAQLASLADETPEGRSIVVLAKERFDIRERDLGATTPSSRSRPPPACRASTSTAARSARGRPSRSSAGSTEQGGTVPADLDPIVERDLPGRAPPRWWWPTARRSSGSSSSRTSSSRASGRSSTRCARWASAP